MWDLGFVVVGAAVVRVYGQLLVLGFVSCDHSGMVGHHWTGSGHELDMESSAEVHRLQRFWSVLAPQPSKDVLGQNAVTGACLSLMCVTCGFVSGGAQPPLFLRWSTEVWSIPIVVILAEFSMLSVGFWRH